MPPAEPNADPAPVEQLAQQQVTPKPVRLVDHSSSVHLSDVGVRIYTTVLDDTGALWERWSDWPVGQWQEVAGPQR